MEAGGRHHSLGKPGDHGDHDGNGDHNDHGDHGDHGDQGDRCDHGAHGDRDRDCYDCEIQKEMMSQSNILAAIKYSHIDFLFSYFFSQYKNNYLFIVIPFLDY